MVKNEDLQDSLLKLQQEKLKMDADLQQKNQHISLIEKDLTF